MRRSIEEMAAAKAEEVVLEAEVTNKGALALYRNLGFLRDKRLLRWAPFVLHRSVHDCSFRLSHLQEAADQHILRLLCRLTGF